MCHSMHWIMQRSGQLNSLDPYEVAAVLIGALGHDIAHPVSNDSPCITDGLPPVEQLIGYSLCRV